MVIGLKDTNFHDDDDDDDTLYVSKATNRLKYGYNRGSGDYHLVN